jgi:hypothetical protein
MKDQSKITDSSLVSWKNDFNEREYQYLKNIINGLISKGEMDDVSIQTYKDDKKRIMHIFEPFCTLNYIGFMSPSVISIAFTNDEIEFWSGDDNGLQILSDRLTLANKSKMPNNAYSEVDFWHFVDNIGMYTEKPF